MSNATGRFDAEMSDWIVASGFALLVGLVILLWPGPIALTDRIPFALILLLPGSFGLYHAYAESNSPV